jgi:hypothetical protein
MIRNDGLAGSLWWFHRYALRFDDGPADISHVDADRFLPAVGLIRIRELVARYPDFKAEPDLGG